MNDQEMEHLKGLVGTSPATSRVAWNPDAHTCRIVSRVGAPPTPQPGDTPEPSECAYFATGEYAALYNCGISEFAIVTPIMMVEVGR